MRIIFGLYLLGGALGWGEKERVRLEDVDVLALTRGVGGAKDQWEKPKVRNVMGAVLIPILLALGCSEQFSKSS